MGWEIPTGTHHTHSVLAPTLVQGSAEHELPYQGVYTQAHTAITVFSVFFSPGLDASSSLLGQRAKNQQEAEQVSSPVCVSSLHLKLRYNLRSPNDGNWEKSSL